MSPGNSTKACWIKLNVLSKLTAGTNPKSLGVNSPFDCTSASPAIIILIAFGAEAFWSNSNELLLKAESLVSLLSLFSIASLSIVSISRFTWKVVAR